MISKEQLRGSVLEQVREKHRWQEAQEWRHREEPDRLTDEELAYRVQRQAEWEALCALGEEEGWLEWTNDYYGSHLVIKEVTLHPTRTIQVRETVRERKERLRELNLQIEAEVEHLTEASWATLTEAAEIAAQAEGR